MHLHKKKKKKENLRGLQALAIWQIYVANFPKDLSNPDALRTEIDLMSQDIQHVCPRMICGQRPK